MWAKLDKDATITEVTPLNRAELCESVVFLYSQSSLTVLMNDAETADELPTKLFPLWARLYTDTTINKVIPLNRAELFESVVFLHSQNSLTVLINDPETADELPTKLFHSWARLHTDTTINEIMPLNREELFESVVFLHSRSILTMLINDSQTADVLPMKIISFVCEAGHRRNHQ